MSRNPPRTGPPFFVRFHRHSTPVSIMALVTLRVLDGADQGKTFENLPTPITIGREDGNVIQLNDERVSRYHAKILEDQGRLVITDLASTNGTKVNGESIQVALIRPGDLIGIGRSTILVGSRDDIARRLAQLRELDSSIDEEAELFGGDPSAATNELDLELAWEAHAEALSPLQLRNPPELPPRLSPGQAAQLCEVFQYLHAKVRRLVRSADISRNGRTITIGEREWQNLLDLYDRLANYLRQIGNPDDSP
ncbi:FHA domain-containing protein [Thermostilla marina]